MKMFTDFSIFQAKYIHSRTLLHLHKHNARSKKLQEGGTTYKLMMSKEVNCLFRNSKK